MPLPVPDSDETQVEFVQRCMQDETATAEFPDRLQRYAVCNSKWRDNRPSDEIPEDERT